MDAAGLSKSVRRIVLLEQNAAGGVTPVTLYQKAKGGKKKKRSRFFRPLETTIRRVADAAGAYADTYGERHRKSNEKKRDGWIRDLNINVARAARKGTKRLKLSRLIMP